MYRRWAGDRQRPCPTGECPGCKECVYELAWRFRAPNGRRESQSARGYRDLRDLSRSLELAFPGYRLLDQIGALEGPEWWLWGLEVSYEDPCPILPVGVTLGVSMRGVRIPVSTPVNLGSRR